MLTAIPLLNLKTSINGLDTYKMANLQQNSASTSTTEVMNKADEIGEKPQLQTPEDLEKANPNPGTPTSATEWNGPDDPDNPLLWSLWKRTYHVFPPAVISFSA